MTTACLSTAIKMPSSIAYYDGPRPSFDLTGDFYLWKRQVRQALRELSLIGCKDSSLASYQVPSFVQSMHKLYGECQFSIFVSSRAWQQVGLDGRAGQELQLLQRQLNAFDEPETDDLLATNTQWQLILAQALLVMMLL